VSLGKKERNIDIKQKIERKDQKSAALKINFNGESRKQIIN
jgi:hypothetical protein